MRRAFSTLGCAELALEDVLALAARHGIPCVELRALEGTVELPGLFERRYGSPERLAARLAEAPVRVAAIGTSLRLIGNGPGDRDAFLRFLPWAEAMGVDSLRVFDGGRIGDAAELEEARETLSWWRHLRRERGWHGWGASGATAAAIFRWPSARQIRCHMTALPSACHAYWPRSRSTSPSAPPPRRRRRPC